MMTTADARECLLGLNEEHQADRDGGYALVDAIRRTHGELAPRDQAAFDEALGDLVRSEHPQLWAVALEALVQSGDRDQLVVLGKEIRSPTRTAEWKDNLVLGLLRLEERQFREPILAHARESMEKPRNLTIPIVAALCRIDREACLELAVAFFEDAKNSGRNVDGFIPAFVRNFVAVDDAMLAELVGRLAAPRVAAREWLAARFDACLSKPWMLKELGSERSERLRGELRQSAAAGQ